MRVNRTLLYAGIFLIAVGGVVVAADLTSAGEGVLVGALKLWPLALIAVGLGLVLRRTRVSLGSGLLAAAVPGLLLGSAFAAVPRVSGFCAADTTAARATQQGTFDGPASVSVTTDCGSLAVSTGPGNGWQLDAPSGGDRTAVVNASGRSLSIASASRNSGFKDGRDDWNLTLPASGVEDLAVTVNAGRGTVSLGDAGVGRLSLAAHAAEIVGDMSSASVGSFTGAVDVGLLSLHLGSASDFAGSVEVNLGELQVCAPAGLGLRITAPGDVRDFRANGQKVSGSVWQSPGYTSASHQVDLDVDVNFGAVLVNPIGGCR